MQQFNFREIADIAASVETADEIAQETIKELVKAFGGDTEGASQLLLPSELATLMAPNPELVSMPVAFSTGETGDARTGFCLQEGSASIGLVQGGSGSSEPIHFAKVFEDAEFYRVVSASAFAVAVSLTAITDRMISYVTDYLLEEKHKRKGRWADQAAKHELADVVIRRDIGESHTQHALEVGAESPAGRRLLILALLASERACEEALAAARIAAVRRSDAAFLTLAENTHVVVEKLADSAGRPVPLRTALYRATARNV